MAIARVIMLVIISMVALTACSSTTTTTVAKQDSKQDAAPPPVSSTPTKSVTFSGLTVQIPTDFLVKESKKNPQYAGSVDTTYIGAPDVNDFGITAFKMPAQSSPSMQELLENAAADDDGVSRPFKQVPAAEIPLAGIAFQRVNFTVDGVGQGFVMLGTDGTDKVSMSCGPNAEKLYQAYEKIALSLKR